MSMIGSRHQIEVIAKGIDGLSVGQEEPNRADIPVVGTPVDKRSTIAVLCGRCIAGGDVVEYQIGTSVFDAIQNSLAHLFASSVDLRVPITPQPSRDQESGGGRA